MQRYHFKSEVVTPSEDEPRVACPGHTSDVLGVQVVVLFIEHEGRKGLGSGCTGGFKNLNFSSSGYYEESVVRWELQGGDLVSEVEVSDNHSLKHIDDKSKAINIDTNQDWLVVW